MKGDALKLVRRRITFVIAGLSSGGAERAVSTMANYWAARGWAVHILSLDDPEAVPFYPLHASIQVQSLNLFRAYGNPFVAIFQLLGRAWRLRRAITATTPDCVISFDDVTNVFTGLSMFTAKIPVIAAERNDPHCHHLKNPWRFIRVWAYSRARCVVAQTRHALEFFPRQIRDRGRVIPNPVCVPVVNSNENHSRKVGSSSAILALGRLEKQKGFDLLIEAFRTAAAFHPDWRLEIWGEGTERKNLESMIAAAGLRDRISLRGITRNPTTVMRNADLFVLSSRYEGFPNALCEAMASGVPCISFDCPNGPSEIIRDGLDGMLVPRDDSGALAKVLQRLMSNREERLRLGSRASEILQHFGLEKIMGIWTDLLAGVIEETADKPARAKRFSFRSRQFFGLRKTGTRT
jgi:GalNAc-alpha-(1->4)-GalNAc-alpha-(1->3)-diNAcBac-PP-undecaprenol alpha-1,4-N-acetyl-D-galactosaminyltransferase